jgi:xanthine dehydrogenase YagS FAD-binding subunit
MRPFTYQKAATAADAVSAIAAGGAGTRFLAGGTTLYDLMKLNAGEGPKDQLVRTGGIEGFQLRKRIDVDDVRRHFHIELH